MGNWAATDYETYTEIMDELLKPIMAEGLDGETLKNLYESKAVYLENLRVKCFTELNHQKKTYFTWDDYHLIRKAINETRQHVRVLILNSVQSSLEQRRAS